MIVDTSILVADERGRFRMSGFLRTIAPDIARMASISASELLHGAFRAQDVERRSSRLKRAEEIFQQMEVVPFGMEQANAHAQIWADLANRGTLIGAHDLLVAATALVGGEMVATLNIKDFDRVPGLKVFNAEAFLT